MVDCEKFELDMIDYLDGTLDCERLAVLEEHLRICPSCSHRFAAMRVLMDETAALNVDIPDGLHDKIMQRVERKRKGGRLLRFASRRTVAVAAAAVMLVCVASIYGVFHLREQKCMMDTASLERQFMAENHSASSAWDDAANGEADTGDASIDGYFYASDADTPEDGVALNHAAPAECDAEDVAESDPETTSGTLDAGTDLFSHLAEDAHYASVVVMDIEKVPAPLAEYTLLPDIQGNLEKSDEKRDEVFYAIVPADKVDEIVEKCQTEEVKLILYNAENPAPDADLIDTASEKSLFILQITD